MGSVSKHARARCSLPGSLVAQSFDRVEPGGAPRRVERGEEGEGEPDLFTQCLYALVGLGTAGLRGRLAADDGVEL